MEVEAEDMVEVTGAEEDGDGEAEVKEATTEEQDTMEEATLYIIMTIIIIITILTIYPRTFTLLIINLRLVTNELKKTL
jgi:hypothetical protein